MYFVIFVALMYLNVWLTNVAGNITKTFTANNDVRGFAIFGYVAALTKGLSIGYGLWFIYYCVVNFPYSFICTGLLH